MVTNLPANVKATWARASLATNRREKLILLQEVLSGIPKHKGTERLVMSLKRQIKNLEEEIERERASRKSRVFSVWTLKKEGDVLVAVLGRVSDCVAFHQWAIGQKLDETRLFNQPAFGAIKTSGVVIQYALLGVDPTFSATRVKNVSTAAVSSELLIILVNSMHDPIIDLISQFMEQRNITLGPRPVDVSITYVTGGGVRLIGSSKYFTYGQLTNMINEYGIRHAIVKVSENATLDDVKNMILGRTFKPMILLSIQQILSQSHTNLQNMRPESLARKILDTLNKIIVYTKEPGYETPSGAVLINSGTKVKDFAEIIFHKPVMQPIWARVQRRLGVKPLRVGSEFRLEDGDIVELHF